MQVKRAGRAEYGFKLKLLIAGESGAGKTRISSTAPNVLYASAEAGLMSVADRSPAYVDIKTIADLAELRVALAQEPAKRAQIFGCEVDTVVIDTIDEVQRLLTRERLDATRKEALTMQDFGWLGDQVRGIVRGYRNLDLNVIFTVHTKTVTDEESGRVFVKPALQGAMADEIAAYVDLAVVLRSRPVTRQVDGKAERVNVRIMQTAPDNTYPWLKDRSGQLAPELEVNLNDDFDRILRSIFGNPNIPDSVEQEMVAPVEEKTPKAREVSALKRPVGRPPKNPAPTPAGQAEKSELQLPVEETSVSGAPAETPETVVPDAKVDELVCEMCGDAVENQDRADLSRIRYGKTLDKKCFDSMKTNRS